MAQIKYVKSKKEEMAQKGAKANTKAKVTKPAPKPTKRSATKSEEESPAAEMPVSKKATVGKKGVVTKAASTKAARTKAATKATTKGAAPKRTTGKAAAKDTATKPDAAEESATKTPRKRKVADDEEPARPVKKAKALQKGTVLTEPPTQRLHVFVFGEGTAGELGLGTAKKAVDVKRPRLNPNLSAETVGVTKIAAGGMHCVALTHDNQVLTWGVNDQGALGRNTDWEGGLKDMDASDEDSDDEDNDDNGLNPHESTPGAVDWSSTEVAEGTRFVDIAAGDSTSWVLTDDGRVYGWGTFRSNDGPFGFSPEIDVALRPVIMPELKNITSIKAGANHTLAMDNKGAVFAWGSGQQNQLGRRVVERTKKEGLKPREFGLPKGPKKGIVAIETGSYHNFAISKTGDVYAWGLNNFGETGIMQNAGQDEAAVLKPEVVKSLQGKKIISIKGGGHHSLAATDEGDCLIWGRIDGHQMGISDKDIAELPDDAVVKDEHGVARIVAVPQKIDTINGAVTFVTSSSDHNLVVTKEGKAYSWGFSANYQTGQGVDDDVVVATLIDNTAVREQKLNAAFTGGQFSILTAPAEAVKMANGV